MNTYQAALRLVQLGADPGVVAHFIRIETEWQAEKRAAQLAAHPASRKAPKRLQAPPKRFPMVGLPKSARNRVAVAA